MENDYFFLNKDVFVVKGALKAAIYQLSTGDVYSIDACGKKILELSQEGMPVSIINSHITQKNDKSEIVIFLEKLKELGLGSYTKNPQLPSKIEIHPASKLLRKIWLELEEVCNLNCIHCYADASPKRERNHLSHQQWLSVISEGAKLGSKWIQFIGGEPLLHKKRDIFDLISCAHNTGYELVEIFTNGTLIDDEYVDFFAEHRVQIALSIYSKRPQIHDRITRSPGTLHKIVKNAKKLLQKDIPIRFGLILMKQNYEYEEETLEWIKSVFGERPVKRDVIRCTHGGRMYQSSYLTPELWRRKLRPKPDFPKLPLEIFVRNSQGHSCLNGELCIHSNGAVYPCIMDREHILGWVTRSSLAQIIWDSEAQSIWGLSKDHIHLCCDCEYRYACFDCRPMAIVAAQFFCQQQEGLYCKDPCCLYDPYKGEWENVDEFMDKLQKKLVTQKVK